MLTKEWLEKEVKHLHELEEESVERLKNANNRVTNAQIEQRNAQIEQRAAEEHRAAVRAWIEEDEWQLEHFDNPEKTQYNGEGR